ncbi:hypothetical protein [Hahella chejuensis]|nr:hypothetical protein [Hahella chejuensis]
MDKVYLITSLALILVVSHKTKNTHARLVVGALMATYYLSFFPYIDIYASLAEESTAFIQAVFFVPFIIICLMCLTKWVTNANFILSGICIPVFVLSYAITSGFDVKIKNMIAIQSGLFDKALPFPKSIEQEGDKKEFYFPEMGVSLVANIKWNKQYLQSPYFPYISYSENENKIAEIRPKCFNPPTVSIPESIIDLSHRKEIGDIECYTNNDIYSCLARENKSSQYFQKWHWFAISMSNSLSAQIDILQYEDDAFIEREIKNLLSSIKLGQPNGESCPLIVPSEWL